MEETKYRIAIVFFGAVFMGSIFMNPLFAREDLDMPRNSESSKEASAKNKAPEIIVRPHVEYKATGLRDPFQSSKEGKKQVAQAKVAEKPLPNLVIQGIVWGGSLPQAIINNKVVKIGDMIQEVRIIDITKDGVAVSFQSHAYNLSSPAAVFVSTLPVKKSIRGQHEE